MALTINVDDCTACGACEFECPNGAIRTKRGVYIIDAGLCTECDGDKPKCVSVCPSGAPVKA